VFFLKVKLEPSVEERSIRAFLDVLILRLLAYQPMTAYEIDNFILKKFGSRRSPNVIYTKLSIMERNNLIVCVQSRHGRVYNITENGMKIIDDVTGIIKEIQSFAPILLGVKE